MFHYMEYPIDRSSGDVASLVRAFELLKCFTPWITELSNSALAEQTGLAKSTVSRLTGTLLRLGYLRQSGRAYRLGPAVLTLGYAALANVRAREVARPHMQSFAEATQTLVSLATRDRLSMIYLENCRSVANMIQRIHVGTQLPLATTSIGRAYLAGAPAAERESLLEQLAMNHGSAWPTQRDSLTREWQRYADHGYCLSLGEWEKGTNAAATPLTDPQGEELLVLSVGGPAFSVTARQLEDDLAPRLVALARHVEALLER